MQNRNMLFERVPRGLFIFIFLVCDSYLRSALFRLSTVKRFFFESAPWRLLRHFDLKDARFSRGAAVFQLEIPGYKRLKLNEINLFVACSLFTAGRVLQYVRNSYTGEHLQIQSNPFYT